MILIAKACTERKIRARFYFIIIHKFFPINLFFIIEEVTLA